MTALCAGFAPLLIDLEALALFAVFMGLAVAGIFVVYALTSAAMEMEDEE